MKFLAFLSLCWTWAFLPGPSGAACPCNDCICIETTWSNNSHHFTNAPPSVFHYNYNNKAMDDIWGPLSGDDTQYLLRFTIQGMGSNTFKPIVSNLAIQSDITSSVGPYRYLASASNCSIVNTLFDTAMSVPKEMR